MEKPYVEIVLNGGLGNQLFGWACATAASKRSGFSLILNDSELRGRICELPKLGIPVVRQKPMNPLPLFYKLPSQVIQKKPLSFFRPRFNYIEESFEFDRRFLDPKPNSTYYGYFQSWKYFNDFSNQIQETLWKSLPSSDEYDRVRKRIGTPRYIAIHVRRGDYLQNISYHGLTTPEYFNDALEVFGRSREGLKLICISDSIELAREIVPKCDLYLGPNDLNEPTSILRIFAESSGIIGSNSSLSWWGAYLMNRNNLKIFPSKWFSAMAINTSDLLPTSWIQL